MIRSAALFCVALIWIPAILGAQNGFQPHFKLRKNVPGIGSLRKRPVPETVKVLALRVQFEADNNPATTGNGQFDFRDLRDSLTVDPPPHNKQYFEDHLLALRNYFLAVSDGNLQIEFTVKPDQSESSYQLPRVMSTYAPIGTDEQRSDSLSAFFRDALIFADQNDQISFAGYDYFMIFHAGVGEDFALEAGTVNPTPQDLPSRFITLNSLQETFGSDFQGVEVGDGTVIMNGIILPETESQTLPTLFGDQFFEVGLNGIVAANFASQLGIPDLFNTEDGTAAIGVFSLMDQGAFNGDGLIPAELDPWSKIFMGWADPVVIADSSNVRLLTRVEAGSNQIVKLPINVKEYYLVENRQRDVIDNSLSDAVLERIDPVFDGNNFLFNDTVYIAGVTVAPSGVITRVDEYDAALPGRGLLIWHIDENIIEEKIGSNAINADLDNKGVDIEEGGGSQDIGIFFAVGPLGSFNTGDVFDFFFKGNEAFELFNSVRDTAFFSTVSIPNSFSNDLAFSGVSVSNVSEIFTTMSFDVRIDLRQDGFPRFTNPVEGTRHLNFGDLDGDGMLELVTVSPDGKVYGYNHDGSKIIENDATSVIVDLKGDTTEIQVGLLYDFQDSSLSFSPAIGDLDGDLRDEIIVATRSMISVLKIGTGQLADTVFTFASGAQISTSPLVTPEGDIVFGDSQGRITVLGNSGELLLSVNFSAPIAGVAYQPGGYIVVSDGIGIHWLDPESGAILQTVSVGPDGAIAVGSLDGESFNDVVWLSESGGQVINAEFASIPTTFDGTFGFSLAGETIEHFPALGDIDGDGLVEFAFGGENRLYVYNYNGTLTTNFYKTLEHSGERAFVRSSPVIGDIDGDAQPELVVAADNGKVYAYHGDATRVVGFPLQASGAVSSAPALLDLDSDGDLEIALVSDDGYIHVWDIQGTYDDENILWSRYLGDPMNTAFSDEQHVISGVTGSLLPKSRAYNYPNPAKGVAETTIRYFLREDAGIKITIYDMAGDVADKLVGPGIGGTDNEVIWDIRDIQSGIYFARIEAKNKSEKTHQIIKIAVIK